MTSRAALSPAWLGLFAALSFGGLVVASFASGYHLVMKTPRSAPAAPAESPAASTAASPGGTAAAASSGGSAGGVVGAAESAAATAADPSEAIVRPNLRPDRALVRNKPESGAVVARLPSNQRVALRGRNGDWLHIEFERKGKHVDGWTQEANLQLR